MTLWLLCIALAAAAAAALTWPWWFGRGGVHIRRRAANVAAYRSRLRELEADVAAGVLNAAAMEAAKQELAGRLLAETADESTVETKPARSHKAALAVLILLPTFAIAWYVWDGSWRAQQLIAQAQTDPDGAQDQAMEVMIGQLAQRLQNEPDNLDGWTMLGRSYFVLQRYGEAAKAYAQANALSGSKDPDLLVNEGEALGFARDRDLLGRPAQLFDQALGLQPDHAKGLWYAGLAAEEAQNYRQALTHWQRLSRQELPADIQTIVTARMAEWQKLTGATDKAPQTARAETKPVPAIRLRVRISVKPELAARVKPDQTLFVFAKAAEGPPMPLAVQRLPASRLPLEVTLDDSMGMMPQLKLSQFDRWVVSARISQSGGAQAQPGDLQGVRAVAKSESAGLMELVIDEVVR